MTTPAFHALLDQARKTHYATPSLRGFCDFPDDLSPADWSPHKTPAAARFIAERRWDTKQTHPLHAAFLTAAPDAQWRAPYDVDQIPADFRDGFGCYCLVGLGGPWASRIMRAFMVYLPPDVWYPWHQHPAEELYYVLAGSGDFLMDSAATETLGEGQTRFHASGRPHALRTTDRPLLAYVLWRNHFETPPILTPPEAINHMRQPLDGVCV